MDQIEEIRSKIDLVAFISETVPLKKAGRNFKGLCPFHTEKTPSFMVSPERQIWKCFGCNVGGDVYGFLMQMERMEFGEALRLLAKRTGVVLQSYRPSQSESEKDKLFEVNHLASEFFHYLLLSHQVGKKALNYILQRGITKDSLEQFKIGYSTAGWSGLQEYMVGKKGYDHRDLEKAGLVIKSNKTPTSYKLQANYYDRFRDRLMFPLYDHRGNITGFSGRVLDPTIKEAKYVNTPETLIYHKSDLLYPLNITKEDVKKENSAVVVEGELDAISSYQVGIKNVVAIKGSALTEGQSRLLKRFCENVFLSLDSDLAGDIACRRGIEIAEKEGLNLKVLTLEKYKDPDEAAQKDPTYLKQRLAEAQNIYDYFLDSSFNRHRGITAEEKRKIGSELLPIFIKIEDEIVKNVFVQKLAQKLGVSTDAIILQMEKTKFKTVYTARKQDEQEEKPNRQKVLEDYLLSLIFQSKKIDLILDEKNKKLITQPVYEKVILCLQDYLKGNERFSSQFFFNFLPAELREAFNNLYLQDFGEFLENEMWVDREIQKTKILMMEMAIKEEIKSVLTALRQAEEQDNSQAEELRLKVRRLTEELGNLRKF